MISPGIETLRPQGSIIYITELLGEGRISRRSAEKEAERRLLKAAFGDDCELLHAADGAPYLRDDATPISISHGAGRCVLAVSTDGRPIGVDIECWREQLHRVARKFLTPAEMPLYIDEPPLLLRAWSAKEAVFKAAGVPELTISRILVDLDAATATVADGRRFSIDFYGDFPEVLAVARPL